MLLIEQGIPHNWESSEQDVVQLVEPLLVEWLAAESRGKTVPELRKHEHDVFVKDVAHKEGITTVGFTAMGEHQVLKELKLANGIIS